MANDIADDLRSLITLVKKEKESLLSMFLSNATISELADQYKRIDELNEKIVKFRHLA